jgi:hypothetical protein
LVARANSQKAIALMLKLRPTQAAILEKEITGIDVITVGRI